MCEILVVDPSISVETFIGSVRVLDSQFSFVRVFFLSIPPQTTFKENSTHLKSTSKRMAWHGMHHRKKISMAFELWNLYIHFQFIHMYDNPLVHLFSSSFPQFSLISQTKQKSMRSRNQGESLFFSSLFIIIICYSLSLFSHAADLLKQGESLKDGDTLISSEQKFALGFFTPATNSTTGYRYVGIWYHQIPVQTIVWIANRENPIPDTTGIFTMGVDGNLMITDGRGNSIWSANVTATSPPTTNNLTAILENTGNFRLCRDRDIHDSNKFFWQSFDFPTDTFLPGMRVGLNLRTGQNHIFTSWKSSNDPSMGEYNLGVDSTKVAQIVIQKGSKRRWRSGLWNKQSFIGIPNMRSLYLYGFQLSNDDETDGNIFFTYTMANTSDILRFRIGWNGREEQLHWDDGKKEWSVFWAEPTTSCDLYNQCGPSGICNRLETPICRCPHGFEPKSNNEWTKGNWTDGCVRRTELKCESNNGSSSEVAKGDGFLQLDGVKVPDFSRWFEGQNIEECLDRCSMNCSCKAYSFVNGIGCMVWDSDFLDVQKFPEGGQRFYIRLDPSELGGKKKIWIVLIPVILGTILLCVAAYLIWRNKDKFKGFFKKKTNDSMMVYLNKRKEKLKEFSGQDDIVVDGNEGDGPEPSVYSFNAIAVATDYFSFTNKLGQGGFGHVYKGKFPCGAEIAVKRLSKKSGQGLEEFKTEIMLIAKLQHRNLVRILGCCVEGEEKMLIYEYMPNRSLDAFIFDSTNQMQLIWGKRFSIIEGIAWGLLYLHRDSRLRIIHRDLKASNILLDEEMNPKISDFGMAKIFRGNQNQANTNRVVGTYGYMAPEYAMEGLFSVKSDVYSFGVLLLEIVCGKRNTSFHRRSEQSQNILGHAWQLWSEGRTVEFVDQSIRSTCSLSEVDKCIQLGLLCVQDSAMDRPNMAAVVLMLDSETTTLPMPKQPTFSIGRHCADGNSFSGSAEPEIVSTNDVTVTGIIGR